MGNPIHLRKPPNVCAALAIFVRYCQEEQPAEAAQALTPEEVTAARQSIAKIDEWIGRFARALPENNLIKKTTPDQSFNDGVQHPGRVR